MERINLMKSFYLGRSGRRKGKQLELPPGWRGFTCWRSSWKFGWQFWKMGDKEKVTEIEMVGEKVEQTRIIWQNWIISYVFKPLRNSYFCFKQFAILPGDKISHKRHRLLAFFLPLKSVLRAMFKVRFIWERMLPSDPRQVVNVCLLHKYDFF